MIIEPDLPIRYIERNENTTISLFRIIKIYKYNNFCLNFLFLF